MLDRLTPGECFEHPGLHHRLQHRIALHYRLYGLSNCFASRVLRQITTSSSLDRGHDGTVVGVSGQDDDLRVGVTRVDAARCLDPIQCRHAKVHQRYVRPGALDQINRLDTVAGGADHLDPRHQLQNGYQALTHESLVVDHDDAGQVGTQRLTSNPSLVGPDSSVPPTRLARSRRPVNPKPPDASAGFCRPRLETVSVAPPAAYRSRTFTSSASACLRTFVRAS